MTRILISLVFVSSIINNPFVLPTSPVIQGVVAQPEIPSYAKWGQMAVKKTQEKYPNAKVKDYLHIGRSSKNGTSVEQFKLWVRESGKEYPVYVDIEFDTKTEKFINISIKKGN
ncbi:DUF3889 domain-containing protein [Pontibacillus yanchengensis]|uniref:DUF3889 domain-containing protein n=2 Tax=Pontibacillus yanchengensis TaxID=462910 RepID=A0ACC7VCE5_9BACI|nr:DUF3889 domain-containing protein [Pontibacillus yanchengensis]MYL35343.1 DUF3889 domain-containing protein [Pontibacillus yanchengensis]MYL52372.1 DUF3889 domain-containing protein [Pontibacillus yanchengensis]